MSTRLHVTFDDREMLEIRRTSERLGLTMAEWVRQTLRAARSHPPESNADRKLQAIRAAAKHSFPAPDIDRMLAEIAEGYSAGAQP